MPESTSLLPDVPVGTRVIAESLVQSTSATRGYRLHHTMLRIGNPERSIRFYTELMGMSLIFILNSGPFMVYYLGYPNPDDQSPADMATASSSRAGWLELVHVPPQPHEESIYDNLERARYSLKGFGHLGFYVPDVEDALKRAEASGYTVGKTLNDTSITAMELPESLHCTSFHPDFLKSYLQVGFVRDPDGYSIELLPLEWER